MTYDEHILDHLYRWFPYGGGSAEDIFVTFGLDESEFFTRALELLSAIRTGRYRHVAIATMVQLCRGRLRACHRATERSALH
jgi:hypothetical protein